MPPSPSPILVQLVNEESLPVWLTQLIPGLFVLIAAVIALASLRASDKRRLGREDRRQWDSELKASYVALGEEVSKVRRALASTQRTHDEGKELVLTLEAAMTAVSEHVRLFELIAEPKLVEEANKVGSRLAAVWQRAWLAGIEDEVDLRWTARESLEIDDCLDGLRGEIRKALRV
jgi:hypothetical protein